MNLVKTKMAVLKPALFIDCKITISDNKLFFNVYFKDKQNRKHI